MVSEETTNAKAPNEVSASRLKAEANKLAKGKALMSAVGSKDSKKPRGLEAALERFVKDCPTEEQWKLKVKEEERRMDENAAMYKAKSQGFILVNGKLVDSNEEALFKFLEEKSGSKMKGKSA